MKTLFRFIGDVEAPLFKNIPKELEYEYSEDVTIREFLLYISTMVEGIDIDNESELIGHFSFVINGKHRKVRLEYSLAKLINNFYLPRDVVEIVLIFAYGIGGGFEFKKIAWISMKTRNEHQEPHVHISTLNSKIDSVGISLTTITPMYGQERQYHSMFTRQQRNDIEKFLRENANKMKEEYKNHLDGIYIEHVIVYCYDGKEYSFQKERSY
ncbi:MAG: hypothetical protein PUA49_00220 [Butyrivibrio sp.]|nr:hypothetical protein [Butyrivibrio sp.]